MLLRIAILDLIRPNNDGILPRYTPCANFAQIWCKGWKRFTGLPAQKPVPDTIMMLALRFLGHEDLVRCCLTTKHIRCLVTILPVLNRVVIQAKTEKQLMQERDWKRQRHDRLEWDNILRHDRFGRDTDQRGHPSSDVSSDSDAGYYSGGS